MIRAFDRHTEGQASLIVRFNFGVCPSGCSGQLPDGVIYRSSLRSITMRCPRCGLLWTMTVHQMAKSARTHAQKMAERGSEYAELAGVHADRLGEWATAVNDKRGRNRDAAVS
jgi:hypothetical protein